MKFKAVLLTTVLSFAFSANAEMTKKTNGELVTVSGKVSDVKAQSFKLNANNQSILVEMDDYGWGADGYKLVNGDQVIVSGRVDKDFLEQKKIEAGSVFVKSLNSYFFANNADEEDKIYMPSFFSFSALPEGAFVDLQGTVTKVAGREFTVDTGIRKINVDTKQMAYNPTDKVGFTKINVGDRVRVSGKVDNDFFTGKEIKANYVAEL